MDGRAVKLDDAGLTYVCGKIVGVAFSGKAGSRQTAMPE
jgi:hypothetical protein